jgi:hypothetical protein
MGTKYFIAIIVLVGLFPLYWVFKPLIEGGEREIFFYLRAFIVLFLIGTLGVLRVFNAVVNNTRFLIKLRESVELFRRSLPSIDRSAKDVKDSMGSFSEAVNKNTKQSSQLSKVIEDAKEEIRRKGVTNNTEGV